MLKKRLAENKFVLTFLVVNYLANQTIVLVINRKLSHPLEQLNQRFKAISTGNFSLRFVSDIFNTNCKKYFVLC